MFRKVLVWPEPRLKALNEQVQDVEGSKDLIAMSDPNDFPSSLIGQTKIVVRKRLSQRCGLMASPP